jgi:hypothetical protein
MAAYLIHFNWISGKNRYFCSLAYFSFHAPSPSVTHVTTPHVGDAARTKHLARPSWVLSVRRTATHNACLSPSAASGTNRRHCDCGSILVIVLSMTSISSFGVAFLYVHVSVRRGSVQHVVQYQNHTNSSLWALLVTDTDTDRTSWGTDSHLSVCAEQRALQDGPKCTLNNPSISEHMADRHTTSE